MTPRKGFIQPTYYHKDIKVMKSFGLLNHDFNMGATLQIEFFKSWHSMLVYLFFHSRAFTTKLIMNSNSSYTTKTKRQSYLGDISGLKA